MKGVQYLVNDRGEPQAVVIDLKKHGQLWEDFQDLVVSQARKDEPRISLKTVKAQLRERGILH
jgi:hypothetical protein